MRMSLLRGLLPAVLHLVNGVAFGQTPSEPAPPNQAASFEAASIKPLTSSYEEAFHFTVLPNRLDVKNMNLKFLIEQAWDLPDFAVSGPDSLTRNHFDIVATSGVPVSRAVMQTMLRNLLIERFHLATHSDSRIESQYRLEVLPGGPAMKTAAEGYALPFPPIREGGSIRLNTPMSMRQLAQRLTRYTGKPVVDATNLEGYFQIALTFASEDLAVSGQGVAAPLLTKAIQEQLGLRLVSAKEPLKFLVVDHADDVPVAN
jgi:uncharacterized protein (TIGR03435 family)